MATLSTLLTLCERKPHINGGFPTQRASDANLCCFRGQKSVEQTVEIPVIFDHDNPVMRYKDVVGSGQQRNASTRWIE